ncbi:cutinase family protein [Mycolicibacterium goodii]|uniref:Cutinase n=1 Tax=Mycolicibacterium goodii TaxID=134601 RepID=A0ABS6HYM6_MYCGD|nr:cutinase family protein [Mycolicibacterium goodii]OKH64724.1 cutinase [Mycobacterium sp. SWH-M5]MBU8819331.1 cutinase family protein [Mycolicibacterium goodii]MBU8826610.1 cutinase family protein [Mycolicibacterium goodii]MBU8840020.1 cutinase family protein [Mycolicibacterium goodii]PJK20565.1 cutinase family protein [Mycolicibacterium goodii]
MSTSKPAREPNIVAKAARSAIFPVLALAGIVFGMLAGPTAIASAADNACADVEVVFARGTFEAPGVGATGQAFVDALRDRLPGKSVDVYAVNYPASLDFAQAATGIADASNRIQAVAAQCPNTEIVLGGYSQGAAVAGYTTTSSLPAGYTLPAGISGPMPPAIASHVAAVVLFGTPESWVVNLADRNAPPITIGAPYVAKTVQLCATGDPVCFPGGLDRAAHSAYKTNGMAVQAADFAARQMSGQSATLVQTAGTA